MYTMFSATLAALLVTAGEPPAPLVTVTPTDNGAALCNPNMGWVLHFFDNSPSNYGTRLAPSDTVDDYPGLQVVYLRLAWSFIEPEEGKFNWSIFDTPAARWIAKGKQIAFRVTSSETGCPYATPRWVEQAGAKGHHFANGKIDEKGTFWEPDFGDPIFLEKLDQFLAAFAARYDGDPNVAFIDVGSFGAWGEGHTFPTTQLKYPASTIIKHIDLYRKHFKKTLLLANDDFSFQEENKSIDYAQQHGLGLRDDSIMVGRTAYFHGQMAQAFWPTAATCLESEHYGPSLERGNWGDGTQYINAMEDYHASYASIHWWPHEFLAEQRPIIDKMNQRLGYRLRPASVSWPSEINRDEPLTVDWSWVNTGVAPCYAGGYPCITLTDAKGGAVATIVDETLNVKDLKVGAPGAAPATQSRATYPLPFLLVAGKYTVNVSVGNVYGTPLYNLPLAVGRDKRYPIGSLTVRASDSDYHVSAGDFAFTATGGDFPLFFRILRNQTEEVHPFVHFERNGIIAFQGNPTGNVDLKPLRGRGTANLPMHFDIPESARGGSYNVLVGLFRPAMIGQEHERLEPDPPTPDHRCTLGTLDVDANGKATFHPAEK